MLRSDLMLESDCPELSPLMNRPESACCSRRRGTRRTGGIDNNNDNESDEEAKAMALAESKAKAREEGGAKVEKCKAKGQKGKGIERNVSTSSAYCCWKQVEINTIASGFGHLGPASKTIQRCFLSLSLSLSLYLYISIYLSLFLTLYEYICKKIFYIYIHIYPALFTHTNETHCLYMNNQSHSHTHTHSHKHTMRPYKQTRTKHTC